MVCSSGDKNKSRLHFAVTKSPTALAARRLYGVPGRESIVCSLFFFNAVFPVCAFCCLKLVFPPASIFAMSGAWPALLRNSVTAQIRATHKNTKILSYRSKQFNALKIQNHYFTWRLVRLIFLNLCIIL